MSKDKTYKQIAEGLWDLLDSIDTLPDMLHPTSGEDYKKLHSMVMKRAVRRHDFLKSDGFKLRKPEEAKKAPKKVIPGSLYLRNIS